LRKPNEAPWTRAGIQAIRHDSDRGRAPGEGHVLARRCLASCKANVAERMPVSECICGHT
jgi:hypothetical protein